MFYVNLGALPADKQMYMVAVITSKDPKDTDYDEYDIVLGAGLGKNEVLAAVREDTEFIGLYGTDCRIAGAINQSVGYIIFEDMSKPRD